MYKAMRDVYGEQLAALGESHPELVVLDADVSSSTKSNLFGAAFPRRFFNCGVCESAMLGMAAGLARQGKTPFVNTFAAFLTTLGALGAKTFLSYSGLGIKMVGSYGGLSDSYDGATHHALEDLALMQALPGVEVLVASDEWSTAWLTRYAAETPKPMYLRMSRGASPPVHTQHTAFAPGKGIVVCEGSDVTLLACGMMVHLAVAAARELAQRGISAQVVDMLFIKPLDVPLIEQSARKTGALVVAEEHNIIGGLTSAVCQVIATRALSASVVSVSIGDCHAQSGDYEALRKDMGLDVSDIVAAALASIERKGKRDVK